MKLSKDNTPVKSLNSGLTSIPGNDNGLQSTLMRIQTRDYFDDDNMIESFVP
jgi:hypothetical protein